MSSLRKGEIIIFAFFILLTLVITYPLIFKMDHSIFSDPEWTFDSLGTLYSIWWGKYAWTNNLSFNFNHLVAYPFGFDGSRAVNEPCFFYPRLILSLWKNEFFAYNFFVLASFVLSAVITYYFVYYLTKNKLAGMVSGIIFSFCPNHSLQAFSHLSLTSIQWMPLYVFFLVKLDEKRSYRSAVFWAIAFSIVVLANYYYGYFMVILTVGYILFKVGFRVLRKRHEVWEIANFGVGSLKILKVIMLALVVALVIILPFTFSAIKTTLLPEKSITLASMGYERFYSDLYKYAARLEDYFLPSEYHPVFGRFTLWFVRSYMGGGRHWSERTLYLGVTPLFLALMSIIGWWRRCRGDFYAPLFLFLAIFAFYASLAPTISFWKVKIPTPSYFLYRIVPMFRVYARMGFVVALCIAVLSGFGLRDILVKMKSRIKQIVVALAFTSLILFEYSVIPPFRNVDFSKVPAVYKWLAAQPDDIVIAEYPIFRSIDERHQRYLFYQRIHQKKMINGAQEGTMADAIRKKVENITNPEVPPLLKYLGARYVIVHKDRYSSAEMDTIDRLSGISFIVDFSTAKVYELTAKPLRLMQVLRNFGKLERWEDGREWQWMENNGQLWLCNTTEENISIKLQFKTLSFYKDRTLAVFLNDRLLRKINVPFVSSPGSAIKVCLENVNLPTGENIVRFYSPEGPQKIDDVIHNGDMRRVSIAFSNFQVEEGANW